MAVRDGEVLRNVAEVYDDPGMRWALRMVGTHLHPGSEDATVELAAAASRYRMATGGLILDVASALGGPARFLARRFSATVIGVDMDRRMHSGARTAAHREGLTLRCQQVLARTERLPLRAAWIDAAWSQDAMCHMDKPPVVSEVARVLKPGAVFAFTDWIARSSMTADDRRQLARLWGFPSLLRLSEYAALLDNSGFEVLLAEDRTGTILSLGPRSAASDELWEQDFVQRYGEAALQRQREPGEAWAAMIQAERSGYGMLVARRRED
jgi:SAM-dependent methyltransferase